MKCLVAPVCHLLLRKLRLGIGKNISDRICLIDGLPASSLELFGLFERLIPLSFLQDLIPETGSGSRQGIYSFAVVIWLRIVQRLDAKGTLSSALQQLLQNRPGLCCRIANASARETFRLILEPIAKPGSSCPHW